jgi:hypothetical protein
VSNIIGSKLLGRLGSELSEIQFRELFTELAFVNLHLKDRPIFRSEIDEAGNYVIAAEHPATCEVTELDKKVRGKLMSHVLEQFLPSIEPLHGARKQFLRSLEDGDATFLFDENGRFVSGPATRLPPKDG